MTGEHTCTKCGNTFKSQDALRQHTNSKHYQAPVKSNALKTVLKKHKGKLVVVLVLVVVAGVMLYAFSQGGSGPGAVSFPPRLSSQPIHLHPNLDVVVDGQRIPIQANIGIGARHEPIHTHDPDGVVHVESPDTRAYTLGNFFSIWGKRLDAECVGEYCGAVEMTVDGQPSDEFGAHVLRDGERIVLNVNTRVGSQGGGAS